MREFGQYVNDNPRYRNTEQHPNESVSCFDPNNNLEVIDFTNAIINDIDYITGPYTIHGLKKLKFLSIQGCDISYVINPQLFSDMESLEEVHIGGNRLFENNSLPAAMFQSNIKLSVLNLSYSHLQSIEPDAFINNKHLAVLDLSHNHLDDSSLAALDLSNNNIKHLNLSFNALKTLPSTVRYHFDQFHDLVLDLSGNNFLCNCQHLGFLQWIQSNAAITFVYAGDHVCYDSPGNTIHNIEVDSLYCNWYWEQPAIAVGCSLLLFLFFLIIFVLYRKRWFIRNLVFRLQERLSHSDSDTDGTSYKYDAFVLYSSIDADRLWVHYKLRSELENVFGFRLCIHHRDFPPGLDIIDNIEDAIHSSRKVLVIMSENFVNSDWCIEEVNMTMSVDRSKFIVIMYSDVMLAPVRIPTVIRWLLETRTYIEWAEDAQAQELFWKKLRRALYTKNRVTRPEESQANVESDSQVINLVPSGNVWLNFSHLYHITLKKLLPTWFWHWDIYNSVYWQTIDPISPKIQTTWDLTLINKISNVPCPELQCLTWPGFMVSALFSPWKDITGIPDVFCCLHFKLCMAYTPEKNRLRVLFFERFGFTSSKTTITR